MTFSSITYIVFFTIVISLLAITKLRFLTDRVSMEKLMKARHIILLIASYIFYGWWDFRFCGLMLVLTIISYWSSLKVEKRENKLPYMIVGVVFPLVVLGVFKYFNFFLESIGTVLGKSDVGTLNIILPVGISFYTFQALSYVIDVYRGKLKAERNFFNLALYIAFFPQLVAGPIVKAADFLPQLKEPDRNVSWKNMERGIQIFIFGLCKKLVIADHIAVFVDDVFAKPLAFSSGSVILAVVSYSIQIYFDFSGYSDMAIGSAKCMGYELQRNFNMPYISRNVSEFWKRWHISLSSWLQEYLYFSLGGNRKGKLRTYFNLLATMVLGGLWHGASWNFVLWGTMHGIALCVHKVFQTIFHTKNKEPKPVPKILSIIGTYCYVALCWVFFRAEDLTTMKNVFYRIFVWNVGINQIYVWSVIAIILVLIGTVVALLKQKDMEQPVRGIKKVNGFYPVLDLNKFGSLVTLWVVLGLIIGLAYTGNNPFIYFQF